MKYEHDLPDRALASAQLPSQARSTRRRCQGTSPVEK